MRAARQRTGLFAQRAIELRPRRLQRRHEPEHDRRRQSEAGREQPDAEVGLGRDRARHAFERHHAEQQIADPDREHQSDDAAGDREHEALGERLADQPAASGAERQPHRDLLLPRRRAAQQQVGDVRARDQQHEADHGHQHEERRAARRSGSPTGRARPAGA